MSEALVLGADGAVLYAGAGARRLLGCEPGSLASADGVARLRARLTGLPPGDARDVELSLHGARSVRFDRASLGMVAAGVSLILLRTDTDDRLRTAAHTQWQNLQTLHDAVLHDLRSRLNSIGVNLELLQGNGPAGVHDTLIDELARLHGLIEALAAQFAPQERAPTNDLARMLERLQPLLAAQARACRVGFTLDYTTGPLRVRGCPSEVAHTVLSWLLTGLTHTPASGRLTCTLRHARGEALLTARIADSAGQRVPDGQAHEPVLDLSAGERVGDRPGNDPGAGQTLVLRLPLALSARARDGDGV